MQKEAGKALGQEIAEGDFWRAFLSSFKRGVVRNKSLFSVPPRSVSLTLSVLRTEFVSFFYSYEVAVAVAVQLKVCEI